MNPFYFVKRQHQHDLRRHLETRNKTLYSWHTGHELEELHALKPGEILANLARLAQQDKLLTSSLLLVTTALSLASFHIFMALLSCLILGLLIVLVKQGLELRQTVYAFLFSKPQPQAITAPAVSSEAAGPRFIPISRFRGPTRASCRKPERPTDQVS